MTQKYGTLLKSKARHQKSAHKLELPAVQSGFQIAGGTYVHITDSLLQTFPQLIDGKANRHGLFHVVVSTLIFCPMLSRHRSAL